MNDTPERMIRASELAQYGFCAHAWWLGSVQGFGPSDPERAAAGEVAHRQHGRRAQAAVALSRLGHLLLAVAILLAVLGLVGLLS